jgi:AraC-like DNA-binding protein
METLAELRALIARHCNDGRYQTPIPRVALLRSNRPTAPQQSFQDPMFCVIMQGRKRVMLGEQVYDYDPAKYLVTSVDLPISGSISAATPETPYLSFSLRLDPATLAALLIEMPRPAEDAELSAGLAVSPMTADLLDPVARLLRLLDRPSDIAMLAPLAEREILYRLLLGPQSAMLRQIALADSRLSQISRAICWIRDHYEQPFRMETLAEVSHMSASSLHRHFKAVTTMSPLQFQKRIRLQEARRQLLGQQTDVGSIGFAVGYESPSQFSREYSRLFGAPPARDAQRLRGSAREALELADQL